MCVCGGGAPLLLFTVKAAIAPICPQAVDAKKRASNRAYNISIAKTASSRKVSSATRKCHADLAELNKTVAKLVSKLAESDEIIAALEAQNESSGATNASLEARVEALTEAISANRKEKKGLCERLAEIENKISEMEDMAAECAAEDDDEDEAYVEDQRNRSATRLDNENGIPAGRGYPLELREEVMRFHALGIQPSSIYPALLWKFEQHGLVGDKRPSLWWIYHMRKELRVAVLLLAAASAADPEVSHVSLRSRSNCEIV